MVSLFREPDEPKLGQRRWPKLAILLVAVRLVQLCFLQLWSQVVCRGMAAPYGGAASCGVKRGPRGVPRRPECVLSWEMRAFGLRFVQPRLLP